MQILHDFLRSDALLVIQLATTLGLLVFILVVSVQLISQQRKLWQENADLRDELNGIRERRDLVVKRLSVEQDRHRQLLSKIGDDIYDQRQLLAEDFDSVREVGSPELKKVSVGVSGAAGRIVPESSNDPRYAEVDSFIEPALIGGASTNAATSDLEGPVDDSIDDDSDPLTRALKISKTVGR